MYIKKLSLPNCCLKSAVNFLSWASTGSFQELEFSCPICKKEYKVTNVSSEYGSEELSVDIEKIEKDDKPDE